MATIGSKGNCTCIALSLGVAVLPYFVSRLEMGLKWRVIKRVNSGLPKQCQSFEDLRNSGALNFENFDFIHEAQHLAKCDSRHLLPDSRDED